MRISRATLILLFFGFLAANYLITTMVAGSVAEATIRASRSQGMYFASQSSTPMPQTPSPSPGIYAKGGILQECNGGTNSSGTCYPAASPGPTTVTSADAGATVGSAAAAKLDTCSTGNVGTTCWRYIDVVGQLKAHGILAQ